MASKRKSLCIDEKVLLIRAIEAGEKISDVGRRFGFSRGTVFTIWKNKEKILQARADGISSKRLRKPKYEYLDQAMLSWLKRQRQNNMPLSGPIVRTTAEMFAEHLGLTSFKSSEGWLEKFKQRHHINFGKQPTLGFENEMRLANHIKKFAEAGFPVTKERIRALAYQFAEKLKIKHNFNKNTEKAGHDWMLSFLERNPEISLLQSKGLVTTKAIGLSQQEIEDFYEFLEQNDPLDVPDRIFNGDETGVQRNKEPDNVQVKTDTRDAHAATSGEKVEVRKKEEKSRGGLNKRKTENPAKHTRKMKKFKYEEEMSFLSSFSVEEKNLNSATVPSDDDISTKSYDDEYKTEKSQYSSSDNTDGEGSMTDVSIIRKNRQAPNMNIQKPTSAEKNTTEAHNNVRQTHVIDNNYDEMDQFFLNMSTTVKKLSPYMQAIAKNKVFTLVSEMEIQHLTPGTFASPHSHTHVPHSSQPSHVPNSTVMPASSSNFICKVDIEEEDF